MRQSQETGRLRSGRVHLPIEQGSILTPEVGWARPLDHAAAERVDIGLGVIQIPDLLAVGIVPRHALRAESAPAADDLLRERLVCRRLVARGDRAEDWEDVILMTDLAARAVVDLGIVRIGDTVLKLADIDLASAARPKRCDRPGGARPEALGAELP